MTGFSLTEIIILFVVLVFPLLLHKCIRLQIAYNVKKEIMNSGGKGLPCPYCAEIILPKAEECPFCRSDIKQLVKSV